MIMFVVDATNKERLQESKHFLFHLLDVKTVRNKPILIVANKMEDSQPHTLQHVQQILELDKLEDVQWMLTACR